MGKVPRSHLLICEPEHTSVKQARPMRNPICKISARTRDSTPGWMPSRRDTSRI